MKYTTNAERKTIIIFAGNVARELLKRGFTICDVKPDHLNPMKSVFVFKVENNIEEDIYELTGKKI